VGCIQTKNISIFVSRIKRTRIKILAEARDETGLKIVTEVMTPNDVELVGEYADILQIGARNMQNYQLLDEVGNMVNLYYLNEACLLRLQNGFYQLNIY